jgi:hypothetical protein
MEGKSKHAHNRVARNRVEGQRERNTLTTKEQVQQLLAPQNHHTCLSQSRPDMTGLLRLRRRIAQPLHPQSCHARRKPLDKNATIGFSTTVGQTTHRQKLSRHAWMQAQASTQAHKAAATQLQGIAQLC